MLLRRYPAGGLDLTSEDAFNVSCGVLGSKDPGISLCSWQEPEKREWPRRWSSWPGEGFKGEAKERQEGVEAGRGLRASRGDR